MSLILLATGAGCRAFTAAGDDELELAGRPVSALAREAGGACVAVVDGKEIWRRSASGEWSKVAATELSLESILSVDGTIFGGTSEGAVLFRISANGQVERLPGFDSTPGRAKWFGNGAPLHVRSLTATADGSVILAAVHVGGIPRSADQGESWAPTLPILYDVHEVCAHPSLPNVVIAAAAVGLCVSQDGGRNWRVLADGLEIKNSLAAVMLEDEALFSIQDGPFAKCSQVWRWRMGGEQLEQVREGLPLWLEGKVDTAHLAGGSGRAAVLDSGGNLWLSTAGSSGWKHLARDLPYVFGMVIL